MKKNTKQQTYKPGKIRFQDRFKQFLVRLTAIVARIFRWRKKSNKSRKPYAVSSNYQIIWKLKRIARNIVVLMLVTSVLASAGWVSLLLCKKSDIFMVTSIDIQGSRVVSKKEILGSGGLNRSINLLEMNIQQIAGDIQKHPWIEEVSVKRHWPSSVGIVVREHIPLALINLEVEGQGRLHYIDAKGHVFAPLAISKDLDFPVMTGKALSNNLVEMQVQDGTLVDMGLQVMKLAAKGNQILPLQAISEVHVDKERGVIVYLVDHPFPIYMGKEKIRNRFNLLVRVLAQLYRQDKVKEVAEIRMDYAEDRIMVAGIGAS